MQEMFVSRLRNRVTDRAEVIDDGVLIDTELLADQRWPDNPWIVGQLYNFAINRPGDCYRNRPWQRDPANLTEIFPSSLETGVFCGFQRDRLAEFDNATAFDLSQSKACMGAADID